MKKLSEAEIRKELSDIALWPSSNSHIYMKNLYDDRTGWILFKGSRDKKPITLVPLDDRILKQSPGGVEAESLEALIRQGWVVD